MTAPTIRLRCHNCKNEIVKGRYIIGRRNKKYHTTKPFTCPHCQANIYRYLDQDKINHFSCRLTNLERLVKWVKSFFI